MRVPPLLVRRFLAPLWVAILLVLIVGFAVGVVIGGALFPFGARHRILRLSAFGLCYCSMELAVLAMAAAVWSVHVPQRLVGRGSEDTWLAWNGWILRRALKWVIAGAIRCTGFELIVSEASVPNLSKDHSNLVLARHGGPGDSFVLVQLLLTRYAPEVRIVLKESLQFDPALDVVLNRLHCCFLSPHHAEEGLEQIRDLAAAVKPGEALLLFPEGGNWTPGRWVAAHGHLRRHRQSELARVAELMPNVLPPRLGGVAACLDGQPDLRVFMAAHAGLDRLVTGRQIVDHLPFDVPMTVRIWPASPPPHDEAGRETWLTTEWAVIDEWIEGHRADVIDPV